MKILIRHYLFILLLPFFLTFTSCKTIFKARDKKKEKTEESNKLDPKIEQVVKVAKSHIGTKYKYGGTSSAGFDCSGLMCTCFKEVDVTLPRTSNEQSHFGKPVNSIDELQVGDLVFFGSSPNSKKITHVGMVSFVAPQNILFIHASTKSGVIESQLFSDWYRPRYIKASRPIIPEKE